MTDALGHITLHVLALLGLFRTVVPACFATAKLCVAEYIEFRNWLKKVQR